MIAVLDKSSPEVLRCSVPIMSFTTVHLYVLCDGFLSVLFHNKISYYINIKRASKKAQWVKVFATKPDFLVSVPGPTW